MSDESPVAPRWGTIDTVAKYMSVSRDTVRRLIASGDIPARRFGKRTIRIDLNALDASGKPLGRAAA